MQYSFKELALEAGKNSDFFSEEEKEFNHVINPKLKLQQQVLLFLARDIPGHGEPIIPIFPFSVNSWFHALSTSMIKDVLAVPTDLQNASDIELCRLSELETALGFIKEHGDKPLRECLTETERLDLPSDKVEDLEVDIEILRLSHKVGGLILSSKPDQATKRLRLTPRGKSVYWHIVSSARQDHVEKQLNKRVTAHYGLPPADTYSFLSWKYLTEVRGFIFAPEDFWATNETLLRTLGLSPLNHHSQYGGCDWSDYIGLRNKFVEQGISASCFSEIEEQFMSHLGNDFLNKNAFVSQWPSFVLGRMFKAEHPILYYELEKESKRLLTRIASQFQTCDLAPDPSFLSQSALQLKNTLNSDIMMFMVFYSFVFLFKRLPEIRGSISEKALHPQKYSGHKRGRKTKPRKQWILPIRRPVVELLRSHNVKYSYDKAATILNALALRKVYPTTAIGTKRVSSSQVLVDTKAAKKKGYLTTGGEVLYRELLRK